MAKTHSAIQTITTVGGEASITFNNIPQNYTDLKLVVSVRDTNTPGNTDDGLFIQFNNVTSGYSNKVLYGNGSSALSGSNSYGLTSKSYVGAICTGSATSNTFGNAEIYIPNYTSSNYKSISSDAVLESNGTQVITALNTSLWSNPAAITIINISTNGYTFAANSTFTLYGIGSGAKATGGTVVGAGNYIYHTFTSTGTFVPTESIKNAEVLMVAGGAGGGGQAGGGGGAGGVLYASGQYLIAGTSYPITIGAGGTQGNPGTSGGNTYFGSLYATGGGGGGKSANNQDGVNGGSGGGGAGGYQTSYRQGYGGTGIAGQGNNGGDGRPPNGSGSGASGSGGGGGGAGGVGDTGSNTGNGGVGTAVYSAWGYATQTGANLGGTFYYAGGGGGGSGYQSSNILGLGGFGGGGIGGTAGSSVGGNGGSGVGGNGTANTGGGGGGGGGAQGGGGNSGGSGGSGLVIIRYQVN